MLKKNKKPTLSQRQLRVGELIKKSLSDFLQKDAIHDPELQSISITITQVMLSPDLKKANAYIIPLGGAIHWVTSVVNYCATIFGNYNVQPLDLQPMPRERQVNRNAVIKYRRLLAGIHGT